MKSKSTAFFLGVLTVVFALGILLKDPAYAAFVDVTAGAGITPIPQGDDAVAAVDFDNDWDLDVAISHSTGSGIGLRLYKNDGTGQFSDITADTGVGSIEGKIPSWADFDNDGDQDFAIAVHIPAYLLLFRNKLIETGSLTFTQVLVLPGNWWQPSWVDFDNDGDLDLYLGGGYLQSNAMFRNNLKETGSATFTEVTDDVGLIGPDDNNTYDVAWGDVDNDGDMDLYLANGGGARCCPRPDRFFRNNLKETDVANFTELTADVGLDASQTYSFSGTWADYDNDGDIDLYVGLGQFTPNRLFRNNLIETGSLSFTEIGGASNVQRPFDGGRAEWSDFDNDSDLDLLASGVSNEPWVLHKNLLQESASPNFTDATSAEGLPTLSHVRVTPFFDMDNDGDLDLLVVRVIFRGGVSLYRNDGPTGSFLQVILRGTNSNRDGTGARIVLSAGGQQQFRNAYRHVTWDGGTGGYQEPRRIHFGLGEAETVEELVIHWPSGCVQTLHDIASNQILEMVESCVIIADIDIKPQSCPNPLNVGSRGVLPVAVLGTESFDVTTINPESILLEGVAPIRYAYEDVSAPADVQEPCDCENLPPDGILDLTLKFDTQEIVEAIGEATWENRASVPLALTGNLTEDAGERPIEGEGCVLILMNKGNGKGRR